MSSGSFYSATSGDGSEDDSDDSSWVWSENEWRTRQRPKRHENVPAIPTSAAPRRVRMVARKSILPVASWNTPQAAAKSVAVAVTPEATVPDPPTMANETEGDDGKAKPLVRFGSVASAPRRRPNSSLSSTSSSTDQDQEDAPLSALFLMDEDATPIRSDHESNIFAVLRFSARNEEEEDGESDHQDESDDDEASTDDQDYYFRRRKDPSDQPCDDDIEARRHIEMDEEDEIISMSYDDLDDPLEEEDGGEKKDGKNEATRTKSNADDGSTVVKAARDKHSDQENFQATPTRFGWNEWDMESESSSETGISVGEGQDPTTAWQAGKAWNANNRVDPAKQKSMLSTPRDVAHRSPLREKMGATAMKERLMAAVQANDLSTLRTMMNGKAKDRLSRESLAEALHLAISNGHFQVVTVLWQQVQAIRQPWDRRKSPVGKAMHHVYSVRPDLSPLHAAVNRERTEILRMLLVDYKLDANVLDQNCNTALVVACRKNYVDGIQLLLDQGANPMLGCYRRRHKEPEDRDRFPCGALYAAVEKGLVAATKILLEHGVDPDECPLVDRYKDKGRQLLPLDMAVVAPNRELLRVLLESGATRFGEAETAHGFAEPLLFGMGGSAKAQGSVVRYLAELSAKVNHAAPGARVAANYVARCLRVGIQATQKVHNRRLRLSYLGMCRKLLDAGASATWKGDGFTKSAFELLLETFSSLDDEREPPNGIIDVGLLFFKHGAEPTKKFGSFLLMAFKKKPAVFPELLSVWTSRFPSGRSKEHGSLLGIVCSLPKFVPNLVKAVLVHNSRVLSAVDRDWELVHCLHRMNLDVAVALGKLSVPMLLRINFQYERKVFKETQQQIAKRIDRQRIRARKQRAERQHRRGKMKQMSSRFYMQLFREEEAMQKEVYEEKHDDKSDEAEDVSQPTRMKLSRRKAEDEPIAKASVKTASSVPIQRKSTREEKSPLGRLSDKVVGTCEGVQIQKHPCRAKKSYPTKLSDEKWATAKKPSTKQSLDKGELTANKPCVQMHPTQGMTSSQKKRSPRNVSHAARSGGEGPSPIEKAEKRSGNFQSLEKEKPASEPLGHTRQRSPGRKIAAAFRKMANETCPSQAISDVKPGINQEGPAVVRPIPRELVIAKRITRSTSSQLGSAGVETDSGTAAQNVPLFKEGESSDEVQVTLDNTERSPDSGVAAQKRPATPLQLIPKRRKRQCLENDEGNPPCEAKNGAIMPARAKRKKRMGLYPGVSLISQSVTNEQERARSVRALLEENRKKHGSWLFNRPARHPVSEDEDADDQMLKLSQEEAETKKAA